MAICLNIDTRFDIDQLLYKYYICLLAIQRLRFVSSILCISDRRQSLNPNALYGARPTVDLHIHPIHPPYTRLLPPCLLTSFPGKAASTRTHIRLPEVYQGSQRHTIDPFRATVRSCHVIRNQGPDLTLKSRDFNRLRFSAATRALWYPLPPRSLGILRHIRKGTIIGGTLRSSAPKPSMPGKSDWVGGFFA